MIPFLILILLERRLFSHHPSCYPSDPFPEALHVQRSAMAVRSPVYPLDVSRLHTDYLRTMHSLFSSPCTCTCTYDLPARLSPPFCDVSIRQADSAPGSWPPCGGSVWSSGPDVAPTSSIYLST